MYLVSSYVNGASIIQVSSEKGEKLPFRVVGASVPISAQAGDTVYSLSVHPQKGKGGVVAIAEPASCLNYQQWCMLVKVEVGGSIDGKKVFINPERIGQIYAKGKEAWIEIQFKDRRYTSNEGRAGVATHYVPNNNLLCQYLAGNVGPEAVIHAAIEFRKEQGLSEKLEIAQNEIECLIAENQALLARCKTREEQFLSFSRDVRLWDRLARKLAGELRRKLFLRPEARDLLKDELLGG